jgi:hypothetical protein
MGQGDVRLLKIASSSAMDLALLERSGKAEGCQAWERDENGDRGPERSRTRPAIVRSLYSPAQRRTLREPF